MLIAVIVVALLLVTGGIVAAVLTSGDDDDSGDESSESSSLGTGDAGDPDDGGDPEGDSTGPEAVADTFVEALEGQDCEAAQATMVEPEECDRIMPPADLGVEFGDDPVVEENGETVTVTYEAAPPGETPLPFTVHVTQVDGEWKVEKAGQEAQVPGGSETEEGSSPTESSSSGPVPEEDKREVLSLVQDNLDALAAADCEALRDTMWDANVRCDDIFDEMPKKVEFGTIHDPTGSGNDAYVDVDIIVDGESFPSGMTYHLRNEDRGWEVFDLEFDNS